MIKIDVSALLFYAGSALILLGIITAFFWRNRRIALLFCLTLGLIFVMIGQLLQGRNEALVLLFIIFLGVRKIIAIKHVGVKGRTSKT